LRGCGAEHLYYTTIFLLGAGEQNHKTTCPAWDLHLPASFTTGYYLAAWKKTLQGYNRIKLSRATTG